MMPDREALTRGSTPDRWLVEVTTRDWDGRKRVVIHEYENQTLARHAAAATIATHTTSTALAAESVKVTRG